jgi:hypothetical protein
MPTAEDVIRYIQMPSQRHPPWWIVAAQDAISLGTFTIYPGRTDNEAYLARFWLTPPVSDAEGFTSSDSTYLHYFVRGDNDGAVHDHPNDFDSTILSGGYAEIVAPAHVPFHDHALGLPPPCYADGSPWVGYPELGPDMAKCEVRTRGPGDRATKRAADLHAVSSVLPHTWSLVTTGPKLRSWGFHPFGKVWVPWREFIGFAPLVGKAKA